MRVTKSSKQLTIHAIETDFALNESADGPEYIVELSRRKLSGKLNLHAKRDPLRT
jgi:hypothetical protein